jgi:branched-subunit amino acid transport protein
VSTQLLLLFALMFAVTYPSRAVPLLVPGVERLPDWALTYLRLVGPAVLASLAAANSLVVTTPDGARVLQLGVPALAVVVCAALVAWRRNLLLGLAAAVLIVALARAAGLA